MRATWTALAILAAAFAVDRLTDWTVPTWGWALLAVTGLACLTSDLALAWVKAKQRRQNT